MTLNEKFSHFADNVSEAMGRWQTTAVCLILVSIWLGFGPYANWSDSWQLWVNTPTTVVELFLGFLTLAAANRVEKRNWELHQNMLKIMQHIETMDEDIEEELHEQRRSPSN